MKSKILLSQVLLATATIAALSLSAHGATVVTGVTATASSYYAAQQTPANLVNSSGLSVANNITATHGADPNATGMWHAGSGSPGNGAAPVVNDQFITIDLNGTYDLENIYIWQFNQSGTAALKARGVNQFDLYYSVDNGVNWLAGAQDQTLTVAPNNTNPVSAQSFAFSHSGVTDVRIEIDSAHSGATNAYVGLSEVMFTAVPEPAAALLGSLGLLALLRRRRA